MNKQMNNDNQVTKIMNKCIYNWTTKLTPEGDEDGIEHGARMIEEVGDFGVETNVRQIPVLAADLFVT